MINKINNIISSNNLDGYILPKNDRYFTEYSIINNLKSISNFSGSAGFAIFLKSKKYLFADGRYTTQAENESGKNFEICEIPYVCTKIFGEKIKIGLIQIFYLGNSKQIFWVNTINSFKF